MRDGNVALVKELLQRREGGGRERGVNQRSVSGKTPLHYVAGMAQSAGRRAMAVALVKHGADVDAGNREGETPLLAASYAGAEDVARVLLDAGANPEAADPDGWTALHNACARGHLGVARLLVGRRADINAETNLRMTPLSTFHLLFFTFLWTKKPSLTPPPFLPSSFFV